MNEQEMQFADPDWQPGKQTSAQDNSAGVLRPVNNNLKNDLGSSNVSPHSSYDSSYLSYEQGYQSSTRQAQTPFAPQSVSATDLRQTPGIQARSSHKRSLWWVWLIAIFTFLLVINGMNGSRPVRPFQPSGFNQHPFRGADAGFPSTYSYQSNTATQVQIYDPSGSVTIQGGASSGEITANTDGSVSNALNFTESNNIVTISLTNPSVGDIEVTLPPNITVLNLSGTTNDIEIDSFTGSVTAQTASGNITLRDDTLTGAAESTLSTDTGSIALENGSVTGPATIKSASGTITLDADLSGQITVSTGGDGWLQFNGTLDPHGTYQFSTENGNLNLTLPGDTSTQFEHSTGTGGSYQNDFSDSTGASPRAPVDLHTDSGAISVHNQDS